MTLVIRSPLQAAIGVFLLLIGMPLACAQFHVGDRVFVGSVHEAGTIVEIGSRQSTGGVSIKVHLDRLGAANPSVGVWYDSALSKVGAADATSSDTPRPAPATTHTPTPTPSRATASQSMCKVGDRVAMPAGYQDKWLDAVVIAVDASKPYPCRVHPLGYLDTMDESFSSAMLRAPASIKTEPVGNLANDPRLLALQGKQAFRPSKVLQGAYECYALTSGHLSPRLALNFTILGPNSYRDAAGASGGYDFDAASLGLVFRGAALDGQRATYAQPSNPPNKNTPPNVTFVTSGDSCDLAL